MNTKAIDYGSYVLVTAYAQCITLCLQFQQDGCSVWQFC